jgi:hypothetical protein
VVLVMARGSHAPSSPALAMVFPAWVFCFGLP